MIKEAVLLRVAAPEQLAAAHIDPDTQPADRPVDHIAVGLDLAVVTSTGSPSYISWLPTAAVHLIRVVHRHRSTLDYRACFHYYR